MIQIKSKGYIKQKDNDNHVEGVKWDADYDGNEANIELDVNHNGHIQRRKIRLPHAQLSTLAKLLSVPSVNKPLEKRIMDDYEDEEDTNMFSNYISTPRRMRRRQQTPQIVRIKLEPSMEEQEFLENEYEEDAEDEEEGNEYDNNDKEYQDPQEEMRRMEQLLNLPSSNRSHKKNPKYRKYPTHKVRFSPRKSSRTSKRFTLRGGRKKRNTRRRFKR